jgi:hypothetical protein
MLGYLMGAGQSSKGLGVEARLCYCCSLGLCAACVDVEMQLACCHICSGIIACYLVRGVSAFERTFAQQSLA